MRKTIIIVFSLLLAGLSVRSQTPKDLAGSYYLEGVKDTKSGFQLKANYTFTFFFNYGGIDRYGSGRWTEEKNTIVFNSRPKPFRLYKLLSARRVNDNFVTLKFTDPNPGVIKGIECTLFTSRGRQKLYTDGEGVVRFPRNVVDSIQVFSPFFPDHPFTYIVSNKIQNSFEFAFEKGMAEVFFEDFTLRLVNNMLSGQHPLLNGNQFRYVKDDL